MRSLLLSLICSIFFSNCFSQNDIDKQFPIVAQDLSSSIGSYIEKKGWVNVKVGLLSFENGDENVSELGKFLSNELISWVALHASERFSVVSNKDVEKIINEKEKVAKYRTNEDKMVLLNKYKIVDIVIVGTLTKLNEGYRLNLKALSTNASNVGTVVAIKILTLNRTADFDKMFDAVSIKKTENSQPKVKEIPKETTKTPEPEKKMESNIGKVVEAKMTGTLTRDQNMIGTTVCKLDGKIYVIHSIPGWQGNDIELSAIRYDVIITFTIDKEGSGKYISHHSANARW